MEEELELRRRIKLKEKRLNNIRLSILFITTTIGIFLGIAFSEYTMHIYLGGLLTFLL